VPVLVLVAEIEPVFTTVLDGLPLTETPVVFEVIVPVLFTVVGVDPVIVTPALVPPLIVPLLMTCVVGGVVGLAMVTGPEIVPRGTV